MATLGKDVVVHIKRFTHSNKSTFEWNTIIDNNEIIHTKLHERMLEIISARVTEDLLVTCTIITNYDISYISFINAIFPLLSVYLPEVSKDRHEL